MKDITVLCTTSSFNATKFPSSVKVILNPFKRKLTEEEILQLVSKHQPSGIIAGVEQITRKVMEGAKSVKVISRCGVGLDSVNMDAAVDMGILVFNTPDAPVKAVGELAAGMIYSLVRGLHLYDRNMRKRKWDKFTGGLMEEQTLGIVGCGRIGSYVAGLLKPTGCEIMGHDPHLVSHPLIILEELEYLLLHASVISLHQPYCEDTHQLINTDTIGKMRKGTILVNTSRGGLVDEAALFDALKSGHLGGAGLDVFEEEPYLGPLSSLENVILTPHMASSAGKSRKLMEEEAIDNMIIGLKENALIEGI